MAISRRQIRRLIAQIGRARGSSSGPGTLGTNLSTREKYWWINRRRDKKKAAATPINPVQPQGFPYDFPLNLS